MQIVLIAVCAASSQAIIIRCTQTIYVDAGKVKSNFKAPANLQASRFGPWSPYKKGYTPNLAAAGHSLIRTHQINAERHTHTPPNQTHGCTPSASARSFSSSPFASLSPFLSRSLESDFQSGVLFSYIHLLSSSVAGWNALRIA